MIVTVYSFVMAILWSSSFAIFLSVFRKSNSFIYKFGISSILFLCIGFLFRILFPFELPFVKELEFQGIIANIYDIFGYDLSDENGIFVYKVLAIIWGTVSILMIAYKVTQYFKFTKGIRKLNRKIPNQVIKCKRKIEKELGGIQAELIWSPEIRVPMCTGIKKKMVILPDRLYEEQELYYILKHEYTHLKNKDIHIKILVEAVIILFWWNPCFFLLRHNLSHVLELRCDLAVIGQENLREKAIYLNAIINTIKSNYNKKAYYKLATAEFVRPTHQKKIRQRFNVVADYSKDNQGRRILSPIFSMLFLTTLLLSYMFVIQPSYDPPTEDMGEGGYEVILGDSYIIEKEEGIYILKDIHGNEERVSEEMKNMMLESGFEIRRK